MQPIMPITGVISPQSVQQWQPQAHAQQWPQQWQAMAAQAPIYGAQPMIQPMMYSQYPQFAYPQGQQFPGYTPQSQV